MRRRTGLALVFVVASLTACSSSSGGTGAGGGGGGDSYLMPSPIEDRSAHPFALPVKYGLARKYDGGRLFGSTWTTSPSVAWVVVFSSAPITCSTDFTTDAPVADSPAGFVFPFFLDLSVGAEAQIIGLDFVGGDAGSSGGSSGQRSALDAWIKSTTGATVSGTIDYDAWVGSFTVPVCP